MDRSGVSPAVIFTILLIVLSLGVGGFYWFRQQPAIPALATTPAEPSAASPDAAPSAPPQELLPALDQSDGLVRTVVSELTSHPRLLSWAVSDEDLTRTFVAGVERVAKGKSPRSQMSALAPQGDFRAAADGEGGLVAIAASYARYDLITDIVSAIDTESAALAYRRLRPLLNEAYREIGPQGADFDRALARAIASLQQVPVVESPALDATVEGYRYRNPELEALSPAQKHLLRMGASNVRRVQTKLNEIAAAIGLPPA